MTIPRKLQEGVSGAHGRERETGREEESLRDRERQGEEPGRPPVISPSQSFRPNSAPASQWPHSCRNELTI